MLPVVDCASTIWDPYHQNQINKLEMIQHRGARYALNQLWRRNVRDSVNSLLSSLKWPTLQHRKESTQVILLYKIINHIIQIPPNYFPAPSPVITNRLSNDMKFLRYQPTIDCLKYCFFQEPALSGTNCHQTLFMLIH